MPTEAHVADRDGSGTMACCENVSRISAYHDGELPLAEAHELADHILQCPACRAELSRLRALSEWLSSAPTPEMPPAALERLRCSVRPRRDRAVLRTAKSLMAAAAAVLIVCTMLLWQREPGGTGPVQPVEDWERAAVMPIAREPVLSDAGAEEDVDVQLARSILGLSSMEGGGGYD